MENNEQSIQEAILKIRNDDVYRQKLEKGARAYWEKYGTPVKALELLDSPLTLPEAGRLLKVEY